MGHYNRPQGMEAVLQAQLMEKRVRASEGAGVGGLVGGDPGKTQGASAAAAAAAKCSHNLTTTTKCGETCVPMAKFCVKHIMEDEKQVRLNSR